MPDWLRIEVAGGLYPTHIAHARHRIALRRETRTDQASHPPHTHLFTVRLWIEALGGGQTEQRVQLMSAVSGETRYFRDWPMLVAFVQALLPEKEHSHRMVG